MARKREAGGGAAIVLLVVALGFAGAKKAEAAPKPPEVPYIPPTCGKGYKLVNGECVPTPAPKQPTSEGPRVSLDIWQEATPKEIEQNVERLKTGETGTVGTQTYEKTEPIAIGGTGYTIWGETESGATVISKKSPEEYPTSDWLY